MMAAVEAFAVDPANLNKPLSSGARTYTLAKGDNFSYTDPIDASVAQKQVTRRPLPSAPHRLNKRFRGVPEMWLAYFGVHV